MLLPQDRKEEISKILQSKHSYPGYEMNKINVMTIQSDDLVINGDNFKVLTQEAIPREDRAVARIVEERPRTPWKFELS